MPVTSGDFGWRGERRGCAPLLAAGRRLIGRVGSGHIRRHEEEHEI